MSSRVPVALLVILAVVAAARVPAFASQAPATAAFEAPHASTSDAALRDPSAALETYVTNARSARARLTRGTPQPPPSPVAFARPPSGRVDPPRFAFRRPAPRSSCSDGAVPH